MPGTPSYDARCRASTAAIGRADPACGTGTFHYEPSGRTAEAWRNRARRRDPTRGRGRRAPRVERVSAVGGRSGASRSESACPNAPARNSRLAYKPKVARRAVAIMSRVPRRSPHRLPVPGGPCSRGVAHNDAAASSQPEHRTGVMRGSESVRCPSTGRGWARADGVV
jgi:hypothetical protein